MRSLLNRVAHVLCLCAVSFPVLAQDSPNSVPQSVFANEKSARLTLQEKSSIFSIEVSTNSTNPRSATLCARIISPNGSSLAEGSSPLQLTSVPRRFEVPLKWNPGSGLEDISSARLSFEVLLDGVTTPASSGILSPYKLISDLFELHFVGLDSIGLGKTYFARVRAIHPETNAPVPGVALTGMLGDDNEAETQKSLKAAARTNSRGEAVLKFRLPETTGAPDDTEIDLEIKGSLGNFKNSLITTIRFWRQATVLLSLDKPLYQPEQTLHMRALLIDDQRRAWSKQAARFSVRDPDDTIIFSSDAATSRFGIASADWPISASQKLGFYRVTVKTSTDADSRSLETSQTIRVSRYELPTFTVNVHTKQPFYLPGQNGDLTVSAGYLFGKPVLRGHVRVLRESSRTWNYREQKWDVEESSIQEGELDTKNEFHVSLDLAKDHSNLQDSDWKRFEDLRFAAYLTDASSGRTQERHFDVRISREPIHIYVLNASGPLAAGLAPLFYISSSFADGTPVPADLQIRLFASDPSDPASAKEVLCPLANASGRANKYGIARVLFSSPLLKEPGTERVYAVIDANSSDGRTGKHLESYSFEENRVLRITPAKVILNPGEPIRLKIEASIPNDHIRVDVIRGDTQSILATQDVNLSRGANQLTFPPDEQFVGRMLVLAYPPDSKTFGYYSSYAQVAAATVIFPQATTLKLEISPVKKSYRPGESAAVNLQVRSPEAELAEGAFGLLVYDQALEELASTEASLSTGSYESINPVLGFQDRVDDDPAIAGIHEKNLLNRAPGSSVPADLELVAQALYSSRSWAPIRLESSDSERNFGIIFSDRIHATLNPVTPGLMESFSATGHFPADNAAYSAVLEKNGFDSSKLTDPWGRPYRIQRTYQWLNEILEFRSDGADKISNTSDDFTAYDLRRPFFEFDEKRLRAIVNAHQTSTRSFIRDEAALKLACEQTNTPLSTFLDPWGTPYHFEFGVERDNFSIIVSSAGPDKTFRLEKLRDSSDGGDRIVATIRSPYFAETSQKISDALFENAKATAHFPDNEHEFKEALLKYGIPWDALRGPWGHPYRVTPSTEHAYGDKITVRAYAEKAVSSSTPVTRSLKGITIFSDGPDGIAATSDDFTLARFVSPFIEETGNPAAPPVAAPRIPQSYSGSSGAIRVQVKDPMGAIIANSEVKLTNQVTMIVYGGKSDEDGICIVGNLPAGSYRVLVQSPGFQAYVLTDVPVFSSNVTSVEVTLHVGTTTETVTVEAAAVQVETTSSSLAVSSVQGLALLSKSQTAKGQINFPIGTPRLREYFPETLLWRPEILIDRAGHATVKFPLADSITTWKVSVIASTLDGRIATASTNIRAFQPFFAELDPPKVLTVGDEIHLPVTVRNYLDKPQSVFLDWSPEPWAETLSALTAQLDVPAGDYSQKSFSFRATLPAKDAKQRITAFNRSSNKESDAIERKLRVHPDGQERLLQSSAIFSGSTTLVLDLPGNSLPGSIDAELVVYPNLLAHVSDAIEGIMERPYGCAEQTISSAYPSLLWLQLQKSQNFPASALDERAKHYLNLAYAKLLGYRDSSGGFSFWGKGDPYIPLTAYALRFLTESSEFIQVDSNIVAGTRHWLIQQASPNGTWTEKNSTGQPSDRSTNYYTTYVVQVLSRDLLRSGGTDKKEVETERNLVTNGIQYLSQSVASDLDPYRISLLALAKLSVKQDASSEIDSLLAKRHAEAGTVYWDLQQNTLFYGWGLAGRIETTALVLDALATAKQQGKTDPTRDSALNLGTQFLLKNKDRYNVWYSTQATVNVLQCLVRQLAPDFANHDPANSRLLIQIDGKPGPELPISHDARQLTPRRVNLTPYLGPGPHRVEIRGESSIHASAYLNASYYLPWSDPSVTQNVVPTGDSESIRYSVQFDRTAVSAGDQIRCTVHAERVGFRGYGMMLAEIGLPPGADVNRASLEAAVSANWVVQSYEIQPDRVVAYLWPNAGGATFTFTFKPRFSMNAQSAESILYDYYNPLARASVPPARFTVQ